MSLQTAPEIEAAPYLFNARELARLAVYRAAVVARFYTDQLEPRSGSLRRREASRASLPRKAERA